MSLEITLAGEADIDQLAPLFGGYRVFYQQSPDPEAESAYLVKRMRRGDCTVFLARNDNEPAGFVLLFPTFDSVDLARVWVLHDLFVAPEHRKQGIGRRLMQTAHVFCRDSGASRVDLSTEVTNTVARPLYESMGYQRDTDFFSYSFMLDE